MDDPCIYINIYFANLISFMSRFHIPKLILIYPVPSFGDMVDMSAFGFSPGFPSKARTAYIKSGNKTSFKQFKVHIKT